MFLVNALIAWLQPGEFTELVDRSLVGRSVSVMSGRWVAWAIAVHDLTIGVALLATLWFTSPRRFVLAWAGTWLLAVTLVKLTALQAFGG